MIRRVIGKWLKAGVMEEGCVRHPEKGTPQGGVISPLLANLYLHEVVDRWFEEEVQPRLRGRAALVRYADDFVIVFADEHDARRVYGRCYRSGLLASVCVCTRRRRDWCPFNGHHEGVEADRDERPGQLHLSRVHATSGARVGGRALGQCSSARRPRIGSLGR